MHTSATTAEWFIDLVVDFMCSPSNALFSLGSSMSAMKCLLACQTLGIKQAEKIQHSCDKLMLIIQNHWSIKTKPHLIHAWNRGLFLSSCLHFFFSVHIEKLIWIICVCKNVVVVVFIFPSWFSSWEPLKDLSSIPSGWALSMLVNRWSFFWVLASEALNDKQHVIMQKTPPQALHSFCALSLRLPL